MYKWAMHAWYQYAFILEIEINHASIASWGHMIIIPDIR
jgi:hypothetical protein